MKPERFCEYCNEPILPGERTMQAVRTVAHYECGLRQMLGGANHLRRLCSCYGGTAPPDPPELSKRAAALLCYLIWQRQTMQDDGCPNDD